MSNTTYTILLLLIIALLSSCASLPYKKTASGQLDRLIGREFTSGIQKFGPPTSVYSDGKGGRILAWEQTVSGSTPGVAYTTSFGWDEWDDSYNNDRITLYRPPRTYHQKKFVQLFVHRDGKIYNYRHNVKSVEEKEYEKQKKKNNTVVFIGAAVVLGTAAAVAGNP